MKKKILTLVLLTSTLALITGCVSTVDGKKQVGMPLINDKNVARYDRPSSEVWAAAKNVLVFRGKLIREDVLQNVLEAQVDTRTVWMQVDSSDPKTTRLTVQVRTKSGGSDLALAANLDKEVAVRLASGNLTPATPNR